MSLIRRLALAVALPLAILSIPPCQAAAQAPHRAILREKLLHELTRISDSFDGVMGVEVVDLTDSSRIGVNQDLVFPQGSAIKIPVLIELYRRADRDPGLLAAQHPISKATRTGGSRTLSPAFRRWSGLTRPPFTRTSPVRHMR